MEYLSFDLKNKFLAEMQKFHSEFDELVEDVTNEGSLNKVETEALSRFKEMIRYTVPRSLNSKGLIVVIAYKYLVPDAGEEDLKIARVLGWCAEMLQSSFIVSDDMMDNSELRDGKMCWYRKNKLGNKALNDCFLLESYVYKLIRRFTSRKQYYVHLVELFLEVTDKVVIGQCIDVITCPKEGSLDFTKFNMDRYCEVAKLKCGFSLPLTIAMRMAGISETNFYTIADSIMLEMGLFSQVENDYLDCYDSDVSRKIGNDIEERKCTWLIVRALEVATPEQRRRLMELYEKCNVPDTTAIDEVKRIYQDLDLPSLYAQYEAESYRRVLGMIDSLDGRLPKGIFLEFVNFIYRRQKSKLSS
nr:farnesyl pyrophosphate synthase-like [Biomphalaria glabrata]